MRSEDRCPVCEAEVPPLSWDALTPALAAADLRTNATPLREARRCPSCATRLERRARESWRNVVG
ncbi:MAG TPA: hypothetical protein VGO14_03570 [Solirubrobacteraceae bacterium]|nr:hypothetical protein [Solirubrobacteraceae bacterium]